MLDYITDMLTMVISLEESLLLKSNLYSREYCATVQRRLSIVYLYLVKKCSVKTICHLVDCGKNEVSINVERYRAGGLEGLTNQSYGTNKSDLDAFKSVVLADVLANPVSTISELSERIYTLTGLRRSPSQVRTWANKHGLRRLRTGQIPTKADTQKQQDFDQNVLHPLIQQAENQEIVLLFMDAAHFVMGTFATFLWAFTRVFIRASAGRKRLNVLGAVDAISKQIHLLTNTTYINAQTIEEFLYQLKFAYWGKPIYIVLDNARYQHCDLIRYTAFQLGIKLVFLPPYSPNLNIIERLWKWTKKKCLYAKFYADFDDFSNTIIDTLKSANILYQAEINSLLALKFQHFKIPESTP